jgi:hypothetical protein
MRECKDTIFLVHLHMKKYRYVNYIHAKSIKKTVGGVAMPDGLSFRPGDRHRRHVPPIDAPKHGLPPSGHPGLTSVA